MRSRVGVVFALLALASCGPHMAKTGTRAGVAHPCANVGEARTCGDRVNVRGRVDFTVNPDTLADLDVFFYDKHGELTDQFTTAGCEPESGRTSENAAYAAVIVITRSACTRSATVPFTLAYRVVPRSPCPEIAPSCKPFLARIAGYLILAVLFLPVIVVFVVSGIRRIRDRRRSAS